ncbi:MAG TPA: cyclopropane-fatty-acyl-phospholipid synthase family protein [Acidimicrobiales bacterium]|nr:cyclopropane-fatty-acyl-phospholipid synthase family protein [Acidimicrobiales bacterium]
MPELDTPTIAPSSFLAIRHQRFARVARALLLRQLRRAETSGAGRLIVHERWGERHRDFEFGRGLPLAELTVLDARFYPALVFGGSKGLGRSYVNGLWSSEDLTVLVRFLFRLTQPRRLRLDALGRALRVLAPLWRRRSSESKDRDNIHAHYDLSNDFFALMLDETMAYSCGVFTSEATSLYDAQIEKFDRVCRKLALRPGEHVLEIGTGWGGFAIHAATHYGVRVTTTTISAQQGDWARRRVREAGLDSQIEIRDQHYRDLTGNYDALVSIEMIEAVDWRDYSHFFGALERLVNERGRVALQAITINDQSFDRAKLQPDFIRDLIFPGGCLPSVAAITSALRDYTDLRVVDLEDIGLDYVRTLSHWRDRVASHHDDVAALGFDERFMRLWNLYLSYCEAAFIERHISDVQVIMHRAETRGAPRVG